MCYFIGIRSQKLAAYFKRIFNYAVERLIRLQANDTKETDNKTIGIEQDVYDILIEACRGAVKTGQ